MAVGCPECGAIKSLVDKNNTRADHRLVVRKRTCENGHHFETAERLNGMPIDNVLVRRTGDQQLAEGPFDRSRLLDDVRTGVLKTKRWAEGKDVSEPVALAIEDLELRLSSIAKPLSRKERGERPGHRIAIMDSDVREAVERQLRRGSFRLAHVLYALSTTGRVDRGGREGFKSARDVLDWMDEEENYPDLRLSTPLPELVPVPTDCWWPSGRAPNPDRVIKRNLQDKPDFGYDQFRRSIFRALVGRPNAEETSRLVAEWALWGLAGQREVLSSQLVAGVLECLRRADDIAYLRWATVAKNLTTVREFRAEAVSLVTHPSAHLVFDVSMTPRRPRGRASGHSVE